jgi:flagellar basal body rod protein FlgG
VLIDAAMENAFDRIARRAADVQRAFTPGAVPEFGDVGTPSSSRASLDPLSIAPPSDAYFLTLDDHGCTSYTQNGSFAVRDGLLVDAEGRAVFGFRGDSGAPTELRCDAVDVALGRVRDPRVDATGSFSYDRQAIDPRTGTRISEHVVVGQTALARFPPGTRLSPSAGAVLPPPGVTAHVGRPGDGNFANVAPMRESNSRIDFDRSLDRLEEAYVSFDALQAVRKTRGSLGKTAMDLLK